MSRDEVIRMAREAGLYAQDPHFIFTNAYINERLERFAALVAAREREECAKLCDERKKLYADPEVGWESGHREAADTLGAAIRARGTK